ncbi:CaiB/BaiF CoA transferase family protein [Bradyrhizobium archetypum]|uniref:CoA transferase n=1 Tax=Bradyrhizobium archetypum TaxID=2721160 RepID=A0A7Y4H9D7_9BRAD|nr:CoA transferase [Bradyrhizobium archetypum]NOJ50088.1 CoA transferase [Bradyrhizobium archetypum]
MVDLLKGIRVLSFNHFLMGPMGVQFLADLGADVIAVEPPDGAFQRKWGGADKQVDGQSMLLLTGNRNKRSLTLDLKKPDAVAVAKKLIATSDVLTENFRPGVLNKLGLGYEDARSIKPDIIYAAASGYGADGPYVNRPGQDLLIQALAGLATITGSREHGPRAVGVSAVDHHGAVLFAAGILAALVRKARTGQGCRVDVSLLSAALDLQMESFTCYLNGQRPDDVRQPGPIAGWYYGAPYGIYATRDGHIAISLGSLDVLADLFSLPAAQRVPDTEAYRRRDQASAAFAVNIAKRTTSECLALLESRGIWHARINDYSDVVVDPQVIHNKSFQVVKGATGAPITLVSHPICYDGEVPEVRLPPQKLGAQTEEILKELGYDARQLKDLYDTGAVGSVTSLDPKVL